MRLWSFDMLARVAASTDYLGHMTEVSRSPGRGEGKGGDVKGPFFCNIYTSDLAKPSNFPSPQTSILSTSSQWTMKGCQVAIINPWGGRLNPKSVKGTQQNVPFKPGKYTQRLRLPRRYHFIITEDSSEELTSTLLRSFLAGMSSSVSDFQLAKARGEMRARTSHIWSLLSNIDSLPSADRNWES